MWWWLAGGVAALLAAAIALPGFGAQPRLEPGTLEGAGGDTLVVLLHGFTLGPQALAPVRDALRAQPRFADADMLTPALPFDLFSLAAPGRVVADLVLAIDASWQARVDAGRPYARVVLIGHSMGGLYARKAYAVATGENPQAPFEDELLERLAAAGSDARGVRPWAPAVERVVLLAGMNRGWRISHHMSLTRAVTMWLGTLASRVLATVHGRPPIVFSIRRGSPFITQLRLQWLAMRRHAADKGAGNALTVQLLGTVDDLVAPDDNIDLVSGGDFVYLDVPHSGHRSVIELDDPRHGAGRGEVLVQAATLDDFAGLAVVPAGERIRPDHTVTDVAFVIHGIRDQGYWTHKIARRIVAHGARRGAVYTTETSSYGYFPMLSFLWPGARQAKVEWLMDRYTESLARYPDARFSYVGHSHGTYLLARALEDYPAVRFRHVVFAGSVVRTGFPWARFVGEGRVRRVVNFVATADWVVAFFPKAMQILGVQDLGSAGHDGFDNPDGLDGLEQARYVIGGHAAALDEALWSSIATFVVEGRFAPPDGAHLASAQSALVALPARVAPLVWVLIAAVVLALLVVLVKAPLREWHKTVAVLAYLYLLWLVLTRV